MEKKMEKVKNIIKGKGSLKVNIYMEKEMEKVKNILLSNGTENE